MKAGTREAAEFDGYTIDPTIPAEKRKRSARAALDQLKRSSEGKKSESMARFISHAEQILGKEK